MTNSDTRLVKTFLYLRLANYTNPAHICNRFSKIIITTIIIIIITTTTTIIIIITKKRRRRRRAGEA